MHQGLKSPDGEGGAKEIGNPNYGQNWLKTEWHVLYELFDSKLGTYINFKLWSYVNRKIIILPVYFSKKYEKKFKFCHF